jgi:hypothetical protein
LAVDARFHHLVTNVMSDGTRSVFMLGLNFAILGPCRRLRSGPIFGGICGCGRWRRKDLHRLLYLCTMTVRRYVNPWDVRNLNLSSNQIANRHGFVFDFGGCFCRFCMWIFFFFVYSNFKQNKLVLFLK